MVLVLLVLAGTSARSADRTSFNFAVRPILAAKCFSCHGSDPLNRKGKLRLDQREAALEKQAIVLGDPGASELLKRIESTDPDEVMPPPDRHQALSSKEKSILRQWITEGAEYDTHWAFQMPKDVELPPSSGNPIDALVAAKLSTLSLASAPAAPRDQWLRRVTLALTGLPPSAPELDAFLNDARPEAFEAVVERLLGSPHFGERMAVSWLDAARFGDTYGRHEDADSPMWPWRDWVIKAFNDNLSYDKFLTYQVAGDLLPEAKQDQIIATAFQRLPVQSNESGSDPEEFRWDQVFDRVNTVSSAVLGLTMECSRCHDHKYDPFTTKDYYGLAAYFDKIDELGLFSRYTNGIPPPTAFVYKGIDQQRHEKLKSEVSRCEVGYNAACETAPARFSKWLEQNLPPGQGVGLLGELGTVGGSKCESAFRQPELYVSFDLFDMKEKVYVADNNLRLLAQTGPTMSKDYFGVIGRACAFAREKPKKVGFPGAAVYHRNDPFTFSLWFQADAAQENAVILHRSRAGLDAANRGYELTFLDGKLTATLAHFYPGNAIRIQANERLDFAKWRHIGLSYDGSSRASGLKLYVDGKAIPSTIVRDNLYKDIDYLVEWGDLDNSKVADADTGNEIVLKLGGRTLDAGLRDASLDELRAYDACLSGPEIAWLAGHREKTADTEWREWYQREIDSECKASFALLSAARKAENEFSTHLPEIMVMREPVGQLRQTHILNRGRFSDPREAVNPGVPQSLPPLPAGAPPNRLGLAQWLVSADNPLTSRVAVNRLWAQFFGFGLVTTQEDFGVQGRVPSNPELLDWLAVNFRKTGWDIKALCRLIALSNTYRQSSIGADPRLREADPQNEILARGPRFRLSAEQLRDAALSASGLLVPTLGGPSVKPYQPAGLWEDSGTQHVYEQDKGEALHRRSLYTFWRKTCPPPVMSVFDAPTREFCRVRRENTSTPLQALALLNDTGFLEAARVLAEKLVAAYPQPECSAERITEAFKRLTSAKPSAVQLGEMQALVGEGRAYYQQNPPDAEKLIKAAGDSPIAAVVSATEVAATMLMVRAVMNSEPFLASY